jgi:STE24 endopeptidase
MGSRRVAWITLVVVLIGVLALVVLLVPWRVVPLPVGGTVPDATRDFTPAELSRSAALAASLQPNALFSLGVSLAVSAGLGLTSVGAKIITAAAKPVGGGWVWQVLLGSILLAGIGRLATLPFSAYAETLLHRFGLSTRGWGLWSADVAKSFAIGVGLTALLMVILYGSMRVAPQLWWAIAATLVAALVVVGSFLYPVLIEPVFNRFDSMPQSQLRSDLLDLAERDGVAVDDVLVADASRRTTALNAYVSGFGSTRRIVVYDTLVESESPAVVETIVAHELGHAKANDVVLGTAIGALGAAAAVIAGYLLAGWSALLTRAGAPSLADPRSLALVLFVLAAVGLLLAPAQSLISRQIEARADVHALDLTKDPATFIEMQRRLGIRNIVDLEPNRLYYWVFFSHPSTTERIGTARDWAEANHVPLP